MSEQSPTPNNPQTVGGVPRSIFTDTFAIALGTAFAYLATFVYERAFCSHFDIPPSLINPNISTLLTAAAALAGVLTVAANFLGFTAPLFRAAYDEKRGAFGIIYLMFGMAAVVVIFVSIIYDFGWRGILTSVGIAALTIGFFLVPALLSNRNLPVEARLIKDAEIQANDPFTIDRFLAIWIPFKAVKLVLVLAGFLLFASLIGDGNASTQVRFLTLKGSPDIVVLRSYGDLLITAKFSRETREVTDDLSLIWISEKKQIDFRNEEVGPLRKVKNKTQKQSSSAPPPTNPAASEAAKK